MQGLWKANAGNGRGGEPIPPLSGMLGKVRMGEHALGLP